MAPMTPTIAVAAAADDNGSLAEDARVGLTRVPKELPPKHLYDDVGSRLFDEICDLPEYYPTRAERLILQTDADAIAVRTAAAELVELGSGTAAKSRILLDAMRRAGHLQGYVPFDIADVVVRDSSAAISVEYGGQIQVHGVVGDFERDLHLIPAPNGRPRLVALLGGTLGNFVGEGRRRVLSDIAGLLREGDHALLGADLVKDPAVIEAAYNDARGVTAAFNLNLLSVLDRELDADFEVSNFEHVAFFDAEHEWIEMRLRAREACEVHLRAIDLVVEFAAGEELRTEISAKFSDERLRADLDAAGLELVELYTDPERLYGLALTRLRR